MTVRSLLFNESVRLQIEALTGDKRSIEASIGALEAFHTVVTQRFGAILDELVDGGVMPINPERSNFKLPIRYKGIEGSIIYEGYDLAIQFPDPPNGMANTWSRVTASTLSSETKIAVWMDEIAKRVLYMRKLQEAKQMFDE